MILLLLLLALPNLHLTPGVARPMTALTVCTTRWGVDRRHVTERMKRQVFAAYGIPLRNRRLYEVDHLIPRELGGADEVANLWPQAWPSARQKDREENRLHRAVCAGEVSLVAAQQAMKGWGR